MWVWILVTSFSLILLALIIINAKINGGFKIETSWIALALSPAIIWLISTGQLSEFSGFGLGLKLKQASANPFSLKLDGDMIEPSSIPMDEKEGPYKIKKFIENRIPALVFKLYKEGYYSNQMTIEYLEQLTQYEFFKYAVFIVNDNSQFRGLMSARVLLNQMTKDRLNLKEIIEKGAIERLDGIVTVSISNNGTKREALKEMYDEKISELPVIDESKQFVGIVERDKLASSILLQIVAQL